MNRPGTPASRPCPCRAVTRAITHQTRQTIFTQRCRPRSSRSAISVRASLNSLGPVALHPAFQLREVIRAACDHTFCGPGAAAGRDGGHHNVGGFAESGGGKGFALGVDDLGALLPLGFSLLGHGTFHGVGQLDVLQLHQGHLDAPLHGGDVTASDPVGAGRQPSAATPGAAHQRTGLSSGIPVRAPTTVARGTFCRHQPDDASGSGLERSCSASA
jgi:hypothetical protein